MGNIIVTTSDELQSLIRISIKKSFDEFENRNSIQDQDSIFTVQEASDFLNLAKQTLYGFTSKNEIPFIKKGKKLYFKKSDLQKWLLEGKQKSKSEIIQELNK